MKLTLLVISQKGIDLVNIPAAIHDLTLFCVSSQLVTTSILISKTTANMFLPLCYSVWFRLLLPLLLVVVFAHMTQMQTVLPGEAPFKPLGLLMSCLLHCNVYSGKFKLIRHLFAWPSPAVS